MLLLRASVVRISAAIQSLHTLPSQVRAQVDYHRKRRSPPTACCDLFTYTNFGRLAAASAPKIARNSKMSRTVTCSAIVVMRTITAEIPSRLRLPISIHIAGLSLVYCLIGRLSREGGVTSGSFQG